MDRNLALVLGGGGAAGNAWLIGVVAGLAEAGFDLTQAADLVIGTSAGATAAAQVRSGSAPADLLAAVLGPPARPAGQPGGQRPSPGNASGMPPGSAPATSPGNTPPALPMATVFDRMRAISAAATSAAELQQAMGAFGLECDAVLESAAAPRRATVAARLPRPDWPQRPMMVVTVDAHTGELAVFDQDSGVDLADAVTASCALPGLVPTHPVGGTRCIDGGVRSAENADLAAGYATVLVLSPLGGRTRDPDALPEGQFEGLRREPEWGTDLPSQVEALRAAGSRVAVITPDDESRAAMGTNQLDPATRAPSARAGLAQGRAAAAALEFR